MKRSAGLVALLVLVSLALSRSLSPSPSPSTASSGPAASASGGQPSGGTGSDEEPRAPASEEDLRSRVVYSVSNLFIWPASGPITSYFGLGHPLGIDIGLDPSLDTPVRAAAGGTVTFAGGSACCGYGYYVEIEHEEGLTTLYGHFSRVLVAEGDVVEQGQVIGIGGSTGDADGRHVHFEVQDDDGTQDPLRFLPASQGSGSIGAAACPDEPVRADSGSSLTVDFAAILPQGFGVVEASTERTGAPYPDLETGIAGPSTVWVNVPVARSASGQTYRFALNITAASDDESRALVCEVDIRTMATQANSAATIAAYRAKYLTATATPTATRTPRRTATRHPSATPRPSLTPTPKPGAAKTATPASKAVTPTKPAGR